MTAGEIGLRAGKGEESRVVVGYGWKSASRRGRAELRMEVMAKESVSR